MRVNASKHFDPMLGVDFHSYILPPSVLPTPHISMVFDLWDYAPLIGATVKIHGLCRTVAGTEGKVFHILVGAPLPPVKVPGGPLTISLMRCRPDKRSASGSFAFVISF